MPLDNEKPNRVIKASSAAVLLCASTIWAAPVFADSDTGDASVRVFEQVAASIIVEMDFGRIAIGSRSGVIELQPTSGTRNCDSSMVCVGSFSNSRISLSGSDALVRITFPPDFELTGPGDPMRVEPVFNGGSGAVVQLVGGQIDLDLGARLFVNAGQASGTYSGTFAVTVNYE